MNVLKLTAIGALAAASIEAQATVIMSASTHYHNGDTFNLPEPVMTATYSVNNHPTYPADIQVNSFDLVADNLQDGQIVKSVTTFWNAHGSRAIIVEGNWNALVTGVHAQTLPGNDYDYPDFDKTDVTGMIGAPTKITMDFMRNGYAWNVGDTGIAEGDSFDNGELYRIDWVQNSGGSPYFDGSELIGMEVEVYDQDSGEVMTYLGGQTTFGEYTTGIVDPGAGQNLPEPSSIMFFVMATIPLIFRRKRS